MGPLGPACARVNQAASCSAQRCLPLPPVAPMLAPRLAMTCLHLLSPLPLSPAAPLAAQALLSLHYLDSSTLAATPLIEPFLLDACYESLPVESSSSSSNSGSAGAGGGGTPRLSSWVEGGGGGAEEEEEEEGELVASPRRLRRRGAREAAAELFLPPPFFHPGLPPHDLGCLSARPLPRRGGKSIGLQVGGRAQAARGWLPGALCCVWATGAAGLQVFWVTQTRHASSFSSLLGQEGQPLTCILAVPLHSCCPPAGAAPAAGAERLGADPP